MMGNEGIIVLGSVCKHCDHCGFTNYDWKCRKGLHLKLQGVGCSKYKPIDHSGGGPGSALNDIRP